MSSLIVAPGAAGGLDWMRQVHRPDEVLHVPLQLGPLKNKQGKVLVDKPHGLCVRGDVACCHVGSLTGVALAPGDQVAAWAALTFFLTPGLAPVELLSRDGLDRLVNDAPKPVVELCGRCGGVGTEPDAQPDADGIVPACSRCHGEPRVVDESAAAVQVGPVKVVLADLRPFLRHLGGSDVGLGVAPRVGGPAGALDLHVRHVVDRKGSTGGDWRVTVLAL